VIGITQEQHPDRCRLFMQWQGMDWPVMVDSLNRLDVKVVPITLLIDEAGIIQAVNPRADALEAFLDAPPMPASPATEPVPARRPAPAGVDVAPEQAETDADAEAEWLAAADRDVTWNDGVELDEAIALYRMLVERDPEARRAWFRLGVALRRRSESPAARPTDFAEAITAWSTALSLDPNQYIWRRRIQQYGPRLDKPYPFYDWVTEARAAIVARGDTPHPLRVEPGGAEIAAPLPRGRGDASGPAPPPVTTATSPDPDGRVIRDDGLVTVRVITVPDTAGRGAARVHVIMTPSVAREAWWNNEVEPVMLFLEPGDDAGLQPSTRTVRHEVDDVLGAETRETRTIEFEVQWAADEDAPLALDGHLLFYVCEGREGTCVYRRHDIRIDLPRSSSP